MKAQGAPASFYHTERVLRRALRGTLLIGTALLLANCTPTKTAGIDPKYGVSPSPRVVADGEDVPKGGGYSKVGKPYVIAGEVYTPKDFKKYAAVGMASWYGTGFHGRKTANGEVFDTDSVTAAHPTLPMPSYIRVTNTANGRSIVARVNDRGPFHSKRLIDVSEQVAEALSFKRQGTAKVKVEYIGRAPIEGSDDAQLLASLTTDGTPASLNGDARAPIQVASADDNFVETLTSFVKAPVQMALNTTAVEPVASVEADLPADEFIPLPPVRPKSLVASVSLIPAQSVLTPKASGVVSTVQTASIPPLPVPRPGSLFYAPVNGFSSSPAFDGLSPGAFVPLR